MCQLVVYQEAENKSNNNQKKSTMKITRNQIFELDQLFKNSKSVVANSKPLFKMDFARRIDIIKKQREAIEKGVEKTTEYLEYEKKRMQVIESHAEVDEKKKTKMEIVYSGRKNKIQKYVPVIREDLKEQLQEALDKLDEEYKEVIKEREDQIDEYNKMLKEEVNILISPVYVGDIHRKMTLGDLFVLWPLLENYVPKETVEISLPGNILFSSKSILNVLHYQAREAIGKEFILPMVYNMRKILERIQEIEQKPEFKFMKDVIEEKRYDVISKYSRLDVDGDPILIEIEGGVTYDIPTDNIPLLEEDNKKIDEEYEEEIKKYNDLIAQEFVIPIQKITLEDIGNAFKDEDNSKDPLNRFKPELTTEAAEMLRYFINE